MSSVGMLVSEGYLFSE